VGNLQGYAFNAFAVPELTAAALIFSLGLVVLHHERGSRVGLAMAVAASSISLWFLGLGGAYLSDNAALAQRWILLGQAAVIPVPPAIYQFTVLMVGCYRRHRPVVRIGWIIAVLLEILLLLPGAMYLGTPYHYWWGYYPHYRLGGYAYAAYATLCVLALVYLYGRAWRGEPPGSIMHRRAKLLLIAFLVAAPGTMLLCLPALGVAVYPPGSVVVTLVAFVIVYITLRYRLVDITPEFAAPKILQTMSDAVVVLDTDRTIRVANRAAERLLLSSGGTLVGTRLASYLGAAEVEATQRALEENEDLRSREVHYGPLGRGPRTLSVSASVMRAASGKALASVYVLHDVTARKRAEERIHFLAYYDSLTDLPNRYLMHEEISAALLRAEQQDAMLALMFLDLDGFKRINDTLGHSVGDELLREVARRIRWCLKSDALGPDRNGPGAEDVGIGRLGGDEFIITLGRLSRTSRAALAAEQLLDLLARPFLIGEQELFITGSLGISVYPHDGRDAEALLKNADAAMYFAKNLGRNRYQFYDRSMNETVRRRLELENGLRRAVEREELRLVYQPIVDARSGRVVGAEALSRWLDPDGCEILPKEFIPLAEETGLILPIGEQALRGACRAAAEWGGRPGAPYVSVNLSGSQFLMRQQLPELVGEVLSETGLAPSRLQLEITESVIMQNTVAVDAMLHALKAMGVRIAVDDFGTGYSSLAYLKRFALDTLKVDQTFVSGLGQDAEDTAIIRAIIALGRSLDLQVLPEGVETPSQRDHLLRYGCPMMQGNLFGTPLEDHEFLQMLHATGPGAAVRE